MSYIKNIIKNLIINNPTIKIIILTHTNDDVKIMNEIVFETCYKCGSLYGYYGQNVSWSFLSNECSINMLTYDMCKYLKYPDIFEIRDSSLCYVGNHSKSNFHTYIPVKVNNTEGWFYNPNDDTVLRLNFKEIVSRN